MNFQTDTPSWLTSWVAWRNHFTEPGQQPFNTLIEELDTTARGLYLAYDGAHPTCPRCNEQYVVVDKKWGIVYCICKVLQFQDKRYSMLEDVRSEAEPAYLTEIEYPTKLGMKGIKTLKSAVKEVEHFIKQPDKWLVLTGDVGTGKTHLLRAINTAFYPMSVYLASRDLEDMTHDARKNDNMQELYSLLRYAPILLLDDVGMEYGGPLVKSVVDRIVDARYARFPEFPLVVSSNLTMRELPGYLPRTGDRLRDKEKVKAIGMVGESYRSAT